MTTRPRTALIAGAGIGGLAAALGRRLAAAESVPGAVRHYERVRARRTGAVVALARDTMA